MTELPEPRSLARTAEPKANILLVDDNPANLLSLRAILDDLDQNLVEARSGEEALERVQSDEFAVVLLDVLMPGVGGFETARMIRDGDRSRHTPIIFLTASDIDRPQVEEAYALGAVDILGKPLLPFVLRSKVRGFAELYRDKQRARRETEQLRLLVHATADYAIFMLDPEGHVLTWNSGAERLKGYTAAEITGQHFSRFYPQEAIDRGWPGHELRVARAEGRFEDEGGRVRKDGTQFWANVVITALHDEAGDFVGFSKITRDLTERKRVEEALHEADRHKNEFLATLAHELRNPMAPLRNGLQLLRLTTDPEAREQAREMMERQLGQMVRLVDDLLDISRVSRNKLELRKARIELWAVVQSAVETARPQVEAGGHTLTVTMPPTPVFLHADLIRLAQVFSNLLNNSAKYTEPGGRIRLTAAVQGDEAVVTVEDSGVGIPAEALPHLFEMFSQVDRNLERAQGGLGIGLALVKGLTEAHGGTVEARSAGVGQGSAFVVRLPVTHAGPVQEQQPPRDGTASGPKRRILVVDDNRDGASSLSMLLTLMGHDTRIAHDGIEGVELAEAFRPDLIVLDIGLPRLNGLDACRRIREMPWAKNVVIVAATGWGQDEDRLRSEEAGFDHHLVKPVDAAALTKLLAKGK